MNPLKQTIGYSAEDLKIMVKCIAESMYYIDSNIDCLEETAVGLRTENLSPENLKYTTHSIRKHLERIKENINSLGTGEVTLKGPSYFFSSYERYEERYLPTVLDAHLKTLVEQYKEKNLYV